MLVDEDGSEHPTIDNATRKRRTARPVKANTSQSGLRTRSEQILPSLVLWRRDALLHDLSDIFYMATASRDRSSSGRPSTALDTTAYQCAPCSILALLFGRSRAALSRSSANPLPSRPRPLTSQAVPSRPCPCSYRYSSTSVLSRTSYFTL